MVGSLLANVSLINVTVRRPFLTVGQRGTTIPKNQSRLPKPFCVTLEDTGNQDDRIIN